MHLCHKPDLERARLYWQAYWRREIIDRPCVFVTAPRHPEDKRERPAYMAGFRDGLTYHDAVSQYDNWASSIYFGGEALPRMDISFGPDQFSAFLGAEIVVAQEQRTSWVKPFVTSWDDVHLQVDESEASLWSQMLDYVRFAADYGKNRFLINTLDIHSNLDCLGAIRGARGLCLDIVDQAEEIERMMHQVRPLFAPIYEGIYQAGDMANRGTIGWAPFYCDHRLATIQCDYICLISPEQARRFVIPALEEESAYLDHCVYHLDGPGTLPHLADILAISDIDVIQWVPGAGNPPLIEWLDLLKQIQQAGKGLEINASPEQVKQFHKELRPEGVLYAVSAQSVQEAENLLSWLVDHT